MVTCQSCGSEVDAKSKFCKNCGSKVNVDEEKIDANETKFCENCGKELKEGTDFCPECGAKGGKVVKNGKDYKIPIIIGYIFTLLNLIGGGIICLIIAIAIAIYIITRPEANSKNNNVVAALDSLASNPSGAINELIHNPNDNLYLHGILLIILPIIFFIIAIIFAMLTAPQEEVYYVFWYY